MVQDDAEGKPRARVRVLRQPRLAVIEDLEPGPWASQRAWMNNNKRSSEEQVPSTVVGYILFVG